jgi:hypothetical protein
MNKTLNDEQATIKRSKESMDCFGEMNRRSEKEEIDSS